MMLSSLVEILEMDTNGVTLLTDMRLNLGTEYEIRFADNQEVIKVHGAVQSSTLRKTLQNEDGDVIPLYVAELTFTAADEISRERLEKFVGHHEMDEEEKLRHLVCKVASDDTIKLDFPSDYKVKKLSKGGMLIESGQPTEVDRKIPMELSLPGHVSIRLLGRIACCLINESGDLPFDIGIEFIEMSEEGRKSLDAFIVELEDHEHRDKDYWKHHKDR